MHRLLAVALIALIAFSARASMAQDALPEGFYGHFAGLGLSETMADGKVVDVKPRDFDVMITKSPDGFAVSWKTTEYTIRPRRSKLDAEDEKIVFMKSLRDGLFGEKVPGNLADGESAYWARLSGKTLDVYRLTVNNEGRHEIAVWQRTLKGDSMDLVFQRSGETSQPRVVKGTLTRVKP